MNIRLLAVATLLALTSLAAAQRETYFGVSTGFPLLLTGHLGFIDLVAPDADLRVNFSGALIGTGEGALFAGLVGADLLQRFPDPEGGRFVPYAGGGIGAAYLGVASGGSVEGAFAALVTVLGGAEFGVSGLNLFAELRGTGIIGFGDGGPGFLPVIGLAVGVNFRR
jgi:hypothetical protein